MSMDAFGRKTYKGNFEQTYQGLVPAFDSIEELYKTVGEPEEMLDRMAETIVSQAVARVDECKRRNAKETAMMNLNMQLVVFVFPSILHYNGESSKPLADAVARAWKKAFPKSNVSIADYDTIEKGFKRKWCYITTAVCENTGLGDDCYELNLLRAYRDGYLSEQENGPDLVRTYYDLAPSIVKHIDQQPDSSRIYQEIWSDHIRPCIDLIELGENEACARRYEEMVAELKEKYFLAN
jgi:hypothetical protein